jgi:hypothetical protein
MFAASIAAIQEWPGPAVQIYVLVLISVAA